MSDSRHYLVTGGAGFIGSHMVEEILARGHRATVLDDFSTGSRKNLDGMQGDLSVEAGSITDATLVDRLFDAKPDAVIHLAALPSVSRSVEAPVESNFTNVTGAVTVLDAARRHGTRVVFAGSSSAYGDQDVPAKSENLRESPLSPYAAAKVAGEMYCRSFAKVYELPVVVTRFFNVFGPRQVPDSPYSGVIAAFCYSLLHGKAPRIDGDGKQSRDFTYVSDVVKGVLLATDADTEGCNIVNLACGTSNDLLELLRILKDYSGADVEPNFAPPRVGDVQHSLADISAARSLLGFEPSVSFEEGLEKTFDWYRSSQLTTS